MKTIAFGIQKGGVGKTSISCTTACHIATKGRTILLDFDPQGNASTWLALMGPQYELATVLGGKVTVDKAITPTTIPNLDILATFGLDGELKLYSETQLLTEPLIVFELMKEIAALGYEYAVMDLSPGMGALEKAALRGADEVVTPMTPEAFGLDGLQIFNNELAKAIKPFKSFMAGPVYRRIVVNAHDDRIKQHGDIYVKIKELPYEIYKVPVDPAFRKAQIANKALIQLDRKDGAKVETMAEIARLGDALCL